MIQNQQVAFLDILHLIPKLYFKLSVLTADSLQDSGVSPGQRAVMEDVDRLGPQSVGALARARPVAKQYIQRLVAELSRSGMVTLAPNPADGRSKLVRLTGKGNALLRQWRTHEADRIMQFLKTTNPDHILTTYQTLKKIHQVLIDEMAN